MNTKQIRGLKIEDADAGEVSAVFATLNVVDSDGDVTRPGAFASGEKVRISAYGHESWYGALPVGRGEIHESGEEAIFEGRFFLDTQVGKDTFQVVKEMGELQEWSYGFDIVESASGDFDGEEVQFLDKLKVHEVSPVLLGAGVDTRTLAVKDRKQKLSDHLDQAIGEVEEITERVAAAVVQRAEKGQKLADATLERAAALQSSIERLREALAIEPRTEKDTEAILSEMARFERSRQTI